MSNNNLLDSVLENGQETAEMVARAFSRPDDDWAPSVLLITGSVDRWSAEHFPVQLDGHEEKRRVFALDLPRAIATAGADAVCVSAPVWSLPPGVDGQASNHPDRQELFLISAFTAREQLVRAAAVLRDGIEPPELSPWQDLDGDISRFDCHLYRPAIEALAVANR